MTRFFSPHLCAALALTMPWLAAPVEAATSNNSTSANSVVLSPLSVVNTTPLDFGTIIRGAAAGTVTVDAATGARSVSGGAVAAGGAPQSATFLSAGVINRLVLISLPLTSTTLTNGTGGTMTVSNLALDGPATRIMSSGGVATVKVGGQLGVAANQADGAYAGTFQIIIIYL